MKQKPLFLMIVLLISLVLTGCSVNNASEENEDDFPPKMNGVIIVNETDFEMTRGGFHWERKKGLTTEVVTTDAASPLQIAESYKAIQVKGNETITIKIDEDPQITLRKWEENETYEEVSLEKSSFTVPTDKGRYVYEALANWKNGEISYTFVIEKE
ncbi:hypothetical protein [Fredinandcohnia quinoae]|uniref:Lipoprotein n=1 Tax=Fredinandcohnia quinoae TaxID=2918902 RepID=A0AAW5E3I6_9BACI|nr:hypothetical protein [Fredinandcohnia sp. SECRCQ15]MCH1624561.1 hypothetical protein [Fredinandcohnia sp. SECRCQ15]